MAKTATATADLTDAISARYGVTEEEEKTIRETLKAPLLIQAPLQVCSHCSAPPLTTQPRLCDKLKAQSNALTLFSNHVNGPNVD